LNVSQNREPEPTDSAGQAFIKRIGPAGCALFLALFALVTAICFTSGRAPIPGYAAPHDTAYYAAAPEELVRELEENVFPALSDYVLTAEAEGDGVVVTVEEGNFVAARAALLRYFDGSLFTFRRSGESPDT